LASPEEINLSGKFEHTCSRCAIIARQITAASPTKARTLESWVLIQLENGCFYVDRSLAVIGLPAFRESYQMPVTYGTVGKDLRTILATGTIKEAFRESYQMSVTYGTVGKDLRTILATGAIMETFRESYQMSVTYGTAGRGL
jgi:hypothetical protein